MGVPSPHSREALFERSEARPSALVAELASGGDTGSPQRSALPRVTSLRFAEVEREDEPEGGLPQEQICVTLVSGL